jgi:DNA-binding beta-propeller fold protein YncE
VQFDEYSTTAVKVMQEVMTIANPTPFPNGGPGETYEWCINTVAVDPATNSVFAAAEDGYLYRWDLKTNSFSQHLRLNLARGEAYTPTAVGPDGTVYAINNGFFYAVGN